MFGELNAQIREEVLTLLFHAQLAARGRRGAAARRRRHRRCRERRALVRARVGGGRGRDRRRARRRGRRSGRARCPAARSSGWSTSTRSSAGTTRAGAAPARSSRSATAPDGRLTPPLADDAIRLEPLDERYVPDFERLLEDPTSSATRGFRSSAAAGLRLDVGRPLRRGLAGRLARRASRSSRPTARSSASAAIVDLDLDARQGEIGYVVAHGGARPRRRRPRAPARSPTGRSTSSGSSASSCTSTPRTPPRSASPSAAATSARASCARCTSRRTPRRHRDLLTAARDAIAALRRQQRPHDPHPGWGLAPFPCRRGYRLDAHAFVPDPCRFEPSRSTAGLG